MGKRVKRYRKHRDRPKHSLHRAHKPKEDPVKDWPVYKDLSKKLANVRMTVDIEAGVERGMFEIIVVDMNDVPPKTFKIEDQTVKQLLAGLAILHGPQDVPALNKLGEALELETYVILGFIMRFREFRQAVTDETRKRDEHRRESEGCGGEEPQPDQGGRPAEAEDARGEDVGAEVTS